MGLFSSGKSAAKREAAKAESSEYDKYFAEAINSVRPKEVKLETNTDRYNSNVREYNTRLDEITRQYKGEAITDKVAAATNEVKSAQAAREAAKPKPRQTGIAGIMQGDQGIDPKANRGGIAGIGQSGGINTNNDNGGIGGFLAKQNEEYADSAELAGKTAKFGALNGGYRGLGNQKAAYDDLKDLTGRLNQSAKDDGVEEQIGVENSVGHQNVKLGRKKALGATSGRGSTILTGGVKGRTTGAAPVAKSKPVAKPIGVTPVVKGKK